MPALFYDHPMRHTSIGLLFLFVCGIAGAAAAQSKSQVPLADFLDALSADGLKIIYSSDLVTDDMVLGTLPRDAEPDVRLREALAQFGLEAKPGPAGSLLVVRGAAQPATALVHETPPAPAEEPIPEIVVTSSFHRLQYSRAVVRTRLDRELATRVPTVAEEAVRLTDRLPGTANGGVSTRNHIRGGEANEVLFLLDGLRLYEPYHLKDFQSVATTVNSSAIAGMDFLTGAYPARYGDRMSGVMSMDLREPEKARETELGLSFFNASLLSLGRFGDDESGDWLFSARRGNLDLIVDVVDPDFGSPDYHDILGRVGWFFNPRAVIRASFLYSKDKLSLLDLDRGEQATADYQNDVAWLSWAADWSDKLSSDTILAYSDITNRRDGRLELDGIVSGDLSENREFGVIELRQDWEWVPSPVWMLSGGVNLKRLDGDYRFNSEKRVEPPFDGILGNQPETTNDFLLSPAGAQYAAYSELRWRPLVPLVLEIGLRWDQQTYTTARDDTQLSPRVSVLLQAAEQTSLRLGWGQFYQAQEINELQVSDGIDSFFPAQWAEHYILNVQHRIHGGYGLDVSAYSKRFRDLRPRFENSFNTLTLVPEIQFDRVRIDAQRAEAIGAEVTLSRGNADDALLWWLSYAWARVEDHMPGGDVPRSWDQTNTVKAGLSWRWRDWNFSLAGEGHTGWPGTTLTGELLPSAGGDLLVLAVGERNAERYADFYSADLRISRDFVWPRSRLTTFLEISNASNRPNPCCTEYSLTEQGSLVGKEKHWLPLVPSLGVIWRF